MQTYNSIGEAIGDAMARNANTANARAASNICGPGNCGMCGQPRNEPTTDDRLCVYHPAPQCPDRSDIDPTS